MHNVRFIILVFSLTSCSADPYDDFIKKFADNYIRKTLQQTMTSHPKTSENK